MTLAEADRCLTAKLQACTVAEIVKELFETGGTAVTDPFALVFGTPTMIRSYLACYTTEIERRIEAAREEGKMSIVRSL